MKKTIEIVIINKQATALAVGLQTLVMDVSLVRPAKENRMKVWITYEKDGRGGTCIDTVFRKRDAAINYVIENKFGDSSYYKRLTRDELLKEAACFTSEFEVV